MTIYSRPPRRAAVAAIDPDLLRSGSILIYCRASLTLSLLVYAFIAALVYSDFYVHIIRKTTGTLGRASMLPEMLFLSLTAGSVYLAYHMKPRLEKMALLALGSIFCILFFRQNLEVDSAAYLGLCVLSLVLDLILLTAVIAFYRRYPNYSRLMRNGAGL